MSGIALIFVVGLVNLCLGFAVGVRLGYGPPHGVSKRASAAIDPPPPTADEADMLLAPVGGDDPFGL